MEKLLLQIVEVLERVNRSATTQEKIKNQEFITQKELANELSGILKNLSNGLDELKKIDLKDLYFINNQLNYIHRVFGGATETFDQTYKLIRKLNYNTQKYSQ